MLVENQHEGAALFFFPSSLINKQSRTSRNAIKRCSLYKKKSQWGAVILIGPCLSTFWCFHSEEKRRSSRSVSLTNIMTYRKLYLFCFVYLDVRSAPFHRDAAPAESSWGRTAVKSAASQVNLLQQTNWYFSDVRMLRCFLPESSFSVNRGRVSYLLEKSDNSLVHSHEEAVYVFSILNS